MKLDIFLEAQHYATVTVPDEVMNEGHDFFAKMDADMDRGWQMSREWVENPTPLNRCQIVADKLLTALEHRNETLASLMAGYILSRMPGATGVRINAEDELQETEVLTG